MAKLANKRLSECVLSIQRAIGDMSCASATVVRALTYGPLTSGRSHYAKEAAKWLASASAHLQAASGWMEEE